MLSKIYTTWTFSLCMITSFRPLLRAPFHLSVQFRLCMYTYIYVICSTIFYLCLCFYLFSIMYATLKKFWDQFQIFCNFFFHVRHLAQNPFICDCHLKWLADYLHTNPIETSGARCTSPRRLANKRIGQIKSKKFRCSGNFLSSAAIFILLPKMVVTEVLTKAAGSPLNY